MSETPKKLNVDAALREWPDVEKPATEWEEMARTVEDHVRSGRSGASVTYVSDENLLSDPLGQIPEDGHNSAARGEDKPMTMPVDRERDRRSLQDLAKMALTPPPPSAKSVPSGVQRAAEAKKDDSGIVDLAAAAAADPSAPARAQQTPLATQGLFDDEPASVRPPPSAQQPVPSLPPIPAASVPPASAAMPAASTPIGPVAPAATSSQVAKLAPKKKSGSGAVIALVFGGVVALGAAAAGTFFVMKHRAQQQLASVTTTTAPRAATPATPTVAAPDTTAAPTAAQGDPTPASDDSPMQVANGKPTSRNNAMRGMAMKSPPNAAAVPPRAPAKDEPQKVSQADLPKTAGGPSGSLGDEMKKAVGDSDKGATPVPAAGPSGPQFAPGSVPTKPSQGAVTGALGAVLPAARACLGPDDPISRAVVVFGSNGSVQSVSVSGGAAGKPAEGCIKGALAHAKVAPFAEATYSAPVTIRH